MGADRFHIKSAGLGDILPAVAGGPIGAYAGRMIGQKYNSPDLGMLIGGITGGTAGQLIKEQLQNSKIPAGAPYAIDPTMASIPPWALQGMQDQGMKQGNEHESPMDLIVGEIPFGNVVQKGIQHGPGGALRAFGGAAMGGVPGTLLGLGAGYGLQRLLGRSSSNPINIPGINMSLPEVLGGLGGVLGATKGIRYLEPK